ncbi:MAG: ADP-ribosylation factor-like protein [Candidatus Freyarchaeota archaeon]|nr:ADP-ribosylation factor-like protein [Candidatus Freyrarchaeum guaymaensis]
MIRNVEILDSNGRLMFQKIYGASGIPEEVFDDFIANLAKVVSKIHLDGYVEYMNLRRTRLYYSNVNTTVFIFEADKNDDTNEMKLKMRNLSSQFVNDYADTIEKWDGDPSVFTGFNDKVDELTTTLLKLSLVGFSGVGKTTILKLIREEELPREHIPTIGVGIKGVKGAMIGNTQLVCWDLAGQERFKMTWDKFIKASSLIIIVTDSTLENAVRSRFFVRLVREEEPEANIVALANKQDLPGSLPPEKVEEILGVKTYGFVAIDPMNRSKFFEIIREAVMGL